MTSEDSVLQRRQHGDLLPELEHILELVGLSQHLPKIRTIAERHNAPDLAFRPGFQETYCAIVNWMSQDSLEALVCHNGQQWLFGPSPEQWSVADAKTFANQLVSLWNDWR